MTQRRILCFGELLLRLGAPGRERLLQSPVLDVYVGGAEANVAVSLSRLGHAAALASTVSDNALGEAALGELRRHGVDTRAVRRAPGRMGLYFLATGAGLRPSEVLYDRAGSAFASAPADSYDWPALLEGIDCLHLSGVTPALGQPTAEAAMAAARAGRAAGAMVSFDGNFRPRLWAAWDADPAKILRQLLAEADLAFADHRDIDVVLGPHAAEPAPQPDSAAAHEARIVAAAERAFAEFPRLQRLATTLRVQHSVDRHSLGALMVTRSGTVQRAPQRALEGIVDRIGGGDAFAAGILHGLLTGMEDADALRFGLAAACLKHSQSGDAHLACAEEIAACAREERLDVKR